MHRIEDLQRQGSAVLFVSHDLAAVQNKCERAIWLHNGRIRSMGVTGDVIQAYITWIQEHPPH
jgi:ABC-type polysaccharide/polyol phosphate transport system ATPase subunit